MTMPPLSPLNMRRLVSLVYRMLVMSGLLWNLYAISNIYFTYKVSSQITIRIEETYHPMDLQFCVRYTDLIPKAVQRRKLRTPEIVDDDDFSFRVEQVIKLNEIFAHTPQANDSLSLCRLRDGSRNELLTLEGEECLKYFSVERLVFLEYICYKFSGRETAMNQTASRKHYAVSPVFSGQTSQFALKHFEDAEMCKVALAPYKLNPYAEISVAPQWVAYNRGLMVKPTSIHSQLLPWPYSSNCVDYSAFGFSSRTHCYTSCVYNDTLRKLNKLPNSVLLSESEPSLTIVSYLDLLNHSVAPVVRSIETQCSEKCSHEDCQQQLVVSNILFNSYPGAKKTFWYISVLIPVDPSVEIRTVEKMTLVEYFILFLSAMSTWTSFSFLSFDPSQLIAKRANSRVTVQPIESKVYRWRHERSPVDTTTTPRSHLNIETLHHRERDVQSTIKRWLFNG